MAKARESYDVALDRGGAMDREVILLDESIVAWKSDIALHESIVASLG